MDLLTKEEVLHVANLARIDITVLARLCDYLDCEMKDIIEYVKQK